MKELLFLCHRIPYPPNKGDKIRAFHLLRALARHYTVHLGTFVDDPQDWAHRSKLDELCAQQCYRPLQPRAARFRSLAGLFNGQPLSFPYYHDRALQRWVTRLVRERSIETIVVFSAAMAPYVQYCRQARRVLDFVDVDSEKWRQYAGTASLPMRWVYAREGRKLLAAERVHAASFDASVFVSKAEAELFRERAPESAERVIAINNGVDSAYFDPAQDYADPYAGGGPRTMVFTGAMDYRANIDAVAWFAREVLPLIRQNRPDASFCIVGTRPAREVLELARLPGVTVTGAVPDVRPYLAHAVFAVAPLRIARGLQNKVLEALSMGKQIVLTPEAAAGLLPLGPGFAAVASEPGALAKHAERLLDDNHVAPCAAARAYVLEHYGWDRQLERFLALVAGEGVHTESPSSETVPACEASA